MRGRKRIISLVAVLSVILVFSGVFASGLVDVSKLSLFGGGVEPLSPQVEATVTITPATVVGDYEYSPEYNIGNNFTVDVNVELAVGANLFTWQVNLTWNPAILNFSLVQEYGPFLRGTDSPNGTSGWINRNPATYVTIAVVNNTAGYAAIAETILDKRPDAAGVTGSGRVVSVNFTVVDYGWTEIQVSSLGRLPTTLLNNTGGALEFTSGICWFDNRITGDVDSDGIVFLSDASELRTRWLSTPTSGPYARSADLDLDNLIFLSDASIVRSNWLRTRP